MKKSVSPAVVIAIVVVLLGGLAFVVFKALTGTSDAARVNVKPANPDDPKFKPDPKVGMGGT